MKRCLVVLVFIVLVSPATAQFGGKKCAVVLTYDDALNVHLDNAIPQLDSLGFKGTFYLTAHFPGCQNRLEDWRKAAKTGHELGNHTLYHPCIGGTPDRVWVSPEQDLNSYSMERLLKEISMTNVFLKSLDGKTKRTFAYPCGDMTVKDSSFVPLIKDAFIASRGVKGEMLPVDKLDFTNVGAYGINGHNAGQMIALVKEAMARNTVLVFLFHGVGGEHALNVELPEHRKLLLFLKQHETEIMVAPFGQVMEQLKSRAPRK